MSYVSKEQLAAARELDLLTYLRCHEPEELVHISGGTYATRTHDSLKISNGKWCWWSRGIGGANALDYLVMVRGVSLPNAVEQITGIPGYVPEPLPVNPKPSKQLILPPQHADNRRVFSYLRSRGIDPEIINHCIKHGQIYEDAEYHNCVFVGFRENKPAYAALRGTLSDTTFAGEVPGSDKRFSFAVPVQAGDNPTLCVFEAAIDALSYLTLLKLRGQDWHNANTLSLAGVYRPRRDGQMRIPAALEQYLHDHPHIRKIVLCLDNDEPGRTAAKAIVSALTDYEVMDNPPCHGKDYNDQLRLLKGISGRVRTRGSEAR